MRDISDISWGSTPKRSEFFYPRPAGDPTPYNDRLLREADEKRFKELHEKEVQQQAAYREQLKSVLAEKKQAEQELKNAQAAFAHEEENLKALVSEIGQLEEQVERNDETIKVLNQERTKLRNRLGYPAAKL